MGFLYGNDRKNTRAKRISRMKAKVRKLEKAKSQKVEEARLKAKLNSLRK